MPGRSHYDEQRRGIQTEAVCVPILPDFSGTSAIGNLGSGSAVQARDQSLYLAGIKIWKQHGASLRAGNHDHVPGASGILGLLNPNATAFQAIRDHNNGREIAEV